jgi:phosphatidylinositol alpha-1,6-mannosyltransferase
MNSTVRSLLLTDVFLPHAGGSRMYYYHLYKGWAPDQVTILTKRIPGWQEFDDRESNEYFHIIRRFKPLRNWKYAELPQALGPLAQAFFRVSTQPVDVLHCGDLFPAGVIAMCLKQVFGLPYIAYCYGEEITQTARQRFQPRIRNRIYRSADVVIACTEFSRRLLREIGVADERIRTITPGVECREFTPAPADPGLVARYALQNAFVLLTVARLVARKGHDMVMQAVARLRGEFPQVRYVIVGSGPEENGLRQLAAELGISDRVVFAGFVPQEQLANYYRLGDVMVMPNRVQACDLEGFGLTFLEANAVGKPVIGGRTGGAAEAVSEGVSGVLVDPTDIEQLTAAIRDFILHPRKAEAMGMAGLQRARLNFDWKVRAHELRTITRNLAAARFAQAGETLA